MQSSLSYGLNNTFTLYGGALAAENYRAGAFGVGSNLGRLAPSQPTIRWRERRWRMASASRRSVRFLYAKSFLSSKTDFQIAGYRYSTAGYYSLSDAVNERRRWHNGLYENDYWPSDEDESWLASAPQHYYTSWFYNKSIALIFLPGKLSVRTALSSLTSASKITGIAQEAISRCRRALTALSIT